MIFFIYDDFNENVTKFFTPNEIKNWDKILFQEKLLKKYDYGFSAFILIFPYKANFPLLLLGKKEKIKIW